VETFLKPNKLKGKKVIILGGGDVGCECAVFLAQQGCKITIVEMLEELMLEEEVHSIRVDLLKMLEEEGAEVLTDTRATEVKEKGVTLRSSGGSERFLEADFVVVAVGIRPLSQETHQLAGECVDVRIIGDCLEPRRIRDAVVEGDLAGRLI
jgi:2-enoate reductase